jgi:hypothetical protein
MSSASSAGDSQLPTDDEPFDNPARLTEILNNQAESTEATDDLLLQCASFVEGTIHNILEICIGTFRSSDDIPSKLTKIQWHQSRLVSMAESMSKAIEFGENLRIFQIGVLESTVGLGRSMISLADAGKKVEYRENVLDFLMRFLPLVSSANRSWNATTERARESIRNSMSILQLIEKMMAVFSVVLEVSVTAEPPVEDEDPVKAEDPVNAQVPVKDEDPGKDEQMDDQ